MPVGGSTRPLWPARARPRACKVRRVDAAPAGQGTAVQARHGTLLAHTAGVAAVPSEITHGPDHPVCSPHLYVNVLRAGDGDGGRAECSARGRCRLRGAPPNI